MPVAIAKTLLDGVPLTQISLTTEAYYYMSLLYTSVLFLFLFPLFESQDNFEYIFYLVAAVLEGTPIDPFLSAPFFLFSES